MNQKYIRTIIIRELLDWISFSRIEKELTYSNSISIQVAHGGIQLQMDSRKHGFRDRY